MSVGGAPDLAGSLVRRPCHKGAPCSLGRQSRSLGRRESRGAPRATSSRKVPTRKPYSTCVVRLVAPSLVLPGVVWGCLVTGGLASRLAPSPARRTKSTGLGPGCRSTPRTAPTRSSKRTQPPPSRGLATGKRERPTGPGAPGARMAPLPPGPGLSLIVEALTKQRLRLPARPTLPVAAVTREGGSWDRPSPGWALDA